MAEKEINPDEDLTK